jgi:hypothetical protein
MDCSGSTSATATITDTAEAPGALASVPRTIAPVLFVSKAVVAAKPDLDRPAAAITLMCDPSGNLPIGF